MSDKIVVAMSGGVDSCAAALMLHEQGHDIVGISMQVWDYRKNGGSASRATCCAPSDFDDARTIADEAGFPYYVFDFEKSFNEGVITPFVNSYLKGLTPNPCLDCNRKVKFKELRQRAKALGASHVATGHFAQIRESDDGKLALFTSLDKAKDQSYFLYAMTQSDLATTLFPVGHMEKPAIREYLNDKGFSVASKAESQDICFVGSTAGAFVEKLADKDALQKSGDIVDDGGNKLGEHRGIHHYTVGQRKGLGLSNPNPLYVLNIDADSNAITVGEKSGLEKQSFLIEDTNWISGVEPSEDIRAMVKLRYRHAGVPCVLKNLGEGKTHAVFCEDWSAVSPGQAAVFYNEQVEPDGSRQIFGGGIIAKEEVS